MKDGFVLAISALSLGLAPGAMAEPAPPSLPSSPSERETAAAPKIDSLTVTATRPKEQVLIDRRVYSVGNDVRSTTGAAADLLNQIPSVDVDADGAVSLRGDANVTILVDGKPSAQFSGAGRGLALQQFPARDIDRIEVMTNPPAQYRAEGTAGVINIITRKSRDAGLSGATDLSLGDKRRFVAALTGAYRAGGLKLNGSFSLRQDDKARRVDDTRDAVDPLSGARVVSRETLDEHFIRLTPQVKLAADYAFNDRQSLGLSLSHREQTGKRVFLQRTQSGPEAGGVTSAADRRSDGYEYNISEGEEVHFDQALGRPGETLALAYRRSVYRERERYAYLNDNLLPVGASTRDGLHLSNDLITQEISVDYTLPLDQGRSLKIGYDLEDNRNRFDTIGETVDPVTGARRDNPIITNHFRYHQQVHAGYVQGETPIGAWTLQAGLRLEATDSHYLLITGNLTGSQAYVRAYPSLNLARKLGDDGRLAFSLGRRVTRPDAEALNPFIDTQDIHALRAGNATLRPQETWAYEIGYSGVFRALNYGATAYYQAIHNSFTSVTQVTGADVTLTTQQNLPSSRAAGLDFNLGGRIAARFTYALSGNLAYSQIGASGFGGASPRDTVGLNGKASLDWRPTAADSAQISFSRTDRRLTPQGSVGAINLVNLGYRRKLWGGLSAVVTVTDLFNGQRFRRVVDTATLRDDYTRQVFGRIAYVGLSYGFGLARKAKPGSFDYDAGG